MKKYKLQGNLCPIFLRFGLDRFFSSIFFSQILSPLPPHIGLCCYSERWADSDLHCKLCAPFPHMGNLTKAPRGRQGNAKLIVRNNVFECTALLRIEVMEYGKNEFLNGLKILSQRHTLSTSLLAPLVQAFGFQYRPHLSTAPLGLDLFCTYISLFLVYGNVLCMIQTLINIYSCNTVKITMKTSR